MQRERFDDEDFERLVIATASLPDSLVNILESHIDRPDIYETYKKVAAKVVRAKIFLAGFYFEHNKKTNQWKIMFLNDVDPETTAVPKWIVNRVKTDQLKIVKNIPSVLAKTFEETSGKIILKPYKSQLQSTVK